MTTSAISKTEQYALITLIAKEVGGDNHRLGKKALQKNVHLIQELGGVDAGYRFSFYTYGPYSTSLAGDLDTVASSGGVTISYNTTDNYYLIGPGAGADRVIERGIGFIQGHREAIEGVLQAFGGRLAKDLELVSTIAYLRRHAPTETFEDDQNLVRRVKALKPKYSDNQVLTAINEVKGFLAAQRSVTSQASHS